MDILSKKAVRLLRDRTLQEKVSELLRKAPGAPNSVTITVHDEASETATERSEKQVTLRRIPA